MNSIQILYRKRERNMEYGEDYDAESVYDEIARKLQDDDDLALGENGWIIGFSEGGDKDFTDGADNAGSANIIKDFAKSWYESCAKVISKTIEDLRKKDPDISKSLTQLGRGGYDFYRAVNQMFGFVNCHTEKAFMDENGHIRVCPSNAEIDQIIKEPEEYVLMEIMYDFG